ncbi:MAG: glycosyltransferase family 39 protein [bacterium]|nr:glycosyltransferase family 39 protein [bacterium]
MISAIKRIAPAFILLVISISIIFYQFPHLPKNLSVDEVEFAKLALSLKNSPYVPYSTLATGHSTLYFYTILASFNTFGINNFALRFPSALFSVLSVLVFYFLCKLLFNSKLPTILYQLLPLILSILFTTSRWYFNFARFSFEATFLIFLELVSLYFIFSWLVHPQGGKLKNTLLILTGVFAGLAYNSYTPGRIFVLVPLFVILITFISNKKMHFKNLFNRSNFLNFINFKTLLTFLIPFIIIIIPLTIYISLHKDDRFDKQFYPKNTEMKLSEKINFFTTNIIYIAKEFNIRGDINGRHNYPGKPALNPILGLLFIAGLILTIKSVFSKDSSEKSFNKYVNITFLIYFIIALIPATLTYPWENPNMLRTFTVIPSIIYFVGNSIEWIHTRFIKKIKILPLFILVFLTISCVYEIRTYFVYQSQVFKDAFDARGNLQNNLKIK